MRRRCGILKIAGDFDVEDFLRKHEGNDPKYARELLEAETPDIVLVVMTEEDYGLSSEECREIISLMEGSEERGNQLIPFSVFAGDAWCYGFMSRQAWIMREPLYGIFTETLEAEIAELAMEIEERGIRRDVLWTDSGFKVAVAHWDYKNGMTLPKIGSKKTA